MSILLVNLPYSVMMLVTSLCEVCVQVFELITNKTSKFANGESLYLWYITNSTQWTVHENICLVIYMEKTSNKVSCHHILFLLGLQPIARYYSIHTTILVFCTKPSFTCGVSPLHVKHFSIVVRDPYQDDKK